MALTDDQTAYFDKELGPGTWSADDLSARLLRLDDDQVAAAREVIEGRLAKLRNQPSQFSVPGEYSQGTAANITSYEKQLENMGGAQPSDGGITAGRMARPSLRRRAYGIGLSHPVSELP